jgi:hypothetical protein
MSDRIFAETECVRCLQTTQKACSPIWLLSLCALPFLPLLSPLIPSPLTPQCQDEPSAAFPYIFHFYWEHSNTTFFFFCHFPQISLAIITFGKSFCMTLVTEGNTYTIFPLPLASFWVLPVSVTNEDKKAKWEAKTFVLLASYFADSAIYYQSVHLLWGDSLTAAALRRLWERG